MDINKNLLISLIVSLNNKNNKTKKMNFWNI